MTRQFADFHRVSPFLQLWSSCWL